jgi:hypothetical protein
VGLAPNLYLQEMQSLDLPRRYRTIIVPSSSFQLVLDPAEAARAMDRFAAHIHPGGLLVMPFIEMGRPGQPLEETWTAEADHPPHCVGRLRPRDAARADPRPLRGHRGREGRALRDA